jgi:hypothetical protein
MASLDTEHRTVWRARPPVTVRSWFRIWTDHITVNEDVANEAEIKYCTSPMALVGPGFQRGRVGSITPFVTNCTTSTMTQGSID